MAEQFAKQSVDDARCVLGEEHPSTLASMANLASTYWNQGRWKEAEELFVRVMETSLRVLGEEHPDTLTSMNNLAHTYKAMVARMKLSSLWGLPLVFVKRFSGLVIHTQNRLFLLWPGGCNFDAPLFCQINQVYCANVQCFKPQGNDLHCHNADGHKLS